MKSPLVWLVVYLGPALALTSPCPPCGEVRCVEDLQAEDCPEGHLVDQVMFGCCPACVKYLEYGQPCPGVLWLEEDETLDVSLAYGDTAEADYDLEHWPDSLVSLTGELPCRQVRLDNLYSERSYLLHERAVRVKWVSSRDLSKSVPLVELPACRPDLLCQKLKYADCGDKTCMKYSPGQAPTHPGDSEVSQPDPFPICNARPEWSPGESDEMDCRERPCTCDHIDYTLWAGKQWGEDCSYQFWSPQCEISGVYSPVQHKLNPSQESPVRWCSDPRGGRIFGQEKVTMEESLMTCGCSRKRWELEQDKGMEGQEGRRDVTLHCTETGDYDGLQCDKELCWCVNTISGKPVSIVVAESLVTLLPCHPNVDTESVFGSQYLRKCEAREVSVARTRAVLASHGTSWEVGRDYECQYDGGFAGVQCSGGECQCFTPPGARLGTYGVSLADRAEMTCGCARDQEAGLTSVDHCAGNGDYEPLQITGGQEFCVDPADGWRVGCVVLVPHLLWLGQHSLIFQVSGKVDQTLNCCLDTEYYRAKAKLKLQFN